MKDERTDAVIAAVVAKYPGARVTVGLDPDPLTMRIPIFTIILDAEKSRLREARQFAIDLTVEMFPGEPMPHCIVAVTPETEAEYQRATAAELAQRAAT